MPEEAIRDFGEQPLSRIMKELHLQPTDLVRASQEQLTHKMVAKAVKGRKLNPHVKSKVLNALNQASGAQYALAEIFNY